MSRRLRASQHRRPRTAASAAARRSARCRPRRAAMTSDVREGPTMKKISMKSVLLPLVAALALAGCATATVEPVAAPAAPAAFKELDGRWTQATPAEAQARGEWWKAFRDPVLDDLVARADANSTSVQ